MDPRLVLTIASTAAELFAAYRLIAGKVHRKYPWFTIYLAAGAARSLTWFAGSPRSRAYATVWGITTPALIALQFAVVAEGWRKLMQRYPGIETISRWLATAAIGLAGILGFMTGFDGLAWAFGLNRAGIFAFVVWLARYSGFVLAGLAALCALWAEFFDFEIPANLHRHLRLLAAYFGTVSAGYLAINFLGVGSAALIGSISTGASAGFYILWGLALNAAGERKSKMPQIEPEGAAVLRDLRWITRRVLPF